MVSGAAGSYIVTLTEDAGINTDLMIQPGQDVRISGDPGLADAPSWGSGGFTVGASGSLSLSRIVVEGNLDMDVGATISNTMVLYTVFQHASGECIPYITEAGSLSHGCNSPIPMPVVSGLLPGTLTAMLSQESVGDLTRSRDGAMTSTGLGALPWSLEWNSGLNVPDTAGRPFKLFLLPAQRPGFFSYDARGTQRYSDLCASVGLRTVTSGHPSYYPASTACLQTSPAFQVACAQVPVPYGGEGLCNTLNCLPLASSTNYDVAVWVHEQTGWDNVVTHEIGVSPSLIANYHAGSLTTGDWAVPLRPVCGLEQQMPPPGAFEVISGPCTVSREGRCVGRPNGYDQNEACSIVVRNGGVLGPCPTFQTITQDADAGCGGGAFLERDDAITIASSGVGYSGGEFYAGKGSVHNGHADGCPASTLLMPGETLTWTSGPTDAGAIACGMPAATDLAGWELCF